MARTGPFGFERFEHSKRAKRPERARALLYGLAPHGRESRGPGRKCVLQYLAMNDRFDVLCGRGLELIVMTPADGREQTLHPGRVAHIRCARDFEHVLQLVSENLGAIVRREREVDRDLYESSRQTGTDELRPATP